MKALVCSQFGTPADLAIAEVPRPMPGPGEVRVRIAAAGLNYPDLLAISGTYPIPSTPPFIPGIEGAGLVEALGQGVTRLAIGDRVAWQENRVKSSFAEAVVLPGACLARVPLGVELAVAAAIPTVYGTARFALEHRAALQSGEVLVVHGASGGVGLAAMQLGRAMGARVIATSGSAQKRARLRELGAHEVVATGPTLRDEVRALTGGKGADVVLDPVGGEVFDASVRMLAPYGRLLVIGFTSGSFGTVQSNIVLIRSISVIGANYGHFLETEPDAARAGVEGVLSMIAEGRLTPVVEVADDLARIPHHLGRIAMREVFGKIAVRP